MRTVPAASSRRAFVYILRCADGTLYTGWTYDPVARFKMHCIGAGGKYTRARLPLELAYVEGCKNRSVAMKREIAIKKMKRSQKEKLFA